MNPTIADALTGETVQYSNRLAAVMTNCIFVKRTDGRQTVLALSRLTSVQTLQSSYPGLLVIAAALFLLGVAALSSTEGQGAGIPTLVLGLCSLVGYLTTRRAAVTLISDDEVTTTASGTRAEAAGLTRALRAVLEGSEPPVHPFTPAPYIETPRIPHAPYVPLLSFQATVVRVPE